LDVLAFDDPDSGSSNAGVPNSGVANCVQSLRIHMFQLSPVRVVQIYCQFNDVELLYML